MVEKLWTNAGRCCIFFVVVSVFVNVFLSVLYCNVKIMVEKLWTNAGWCWDK